MDINKLIKSIKMDIGIILEALPGVKDTNEYLMDIMETKTMPSFDEVYPRIIKVTIPREGLIEIPTAKESTDVRYRIPTRFSEGSEILSIRHMRPVASSNTMMGGCGNTCDYTTMGYNRFGRPSINPLYEGSWVTNIAYADAKLAGIYSESLTPTFEPPNIVSFNRKYAQVEMFEFELCIENSPGLMNIPKTAFEAFRELYLLDVRATIYNQYKLYENMDLPIGNLNLMISEWSGAENERKELYREYRNKAVFRTGRIVAG